MGHYLSNLRDIEFNLFELLRVQERMGVGAFSQIDIDLARTLLREANRVAVDVFADSFTEGDRAHLRLEGGEVHLPAGLKRSLDAYFDGDWHRLVLPERFGGLGVPRSLFWAVASLFLGANPAALADTSAPTWAALLDPVVTEEQRKRFLEPMVERRWGATMVLTEADDRVSHWHIHEGTLVNPNYGGLTSTGSRDFKDQGRQQDASHWSSFPSRP